jgi:hypothetical protein
MPAFDESISRPQRARVEIFADWSSLEAEEL